MGHCCPGFVILYELNRAGNHFNCIHPTA